MEMEIWKDIPDYEGLYQVSDTGQVRSLDRITNCKNGRESFHRGIILRPFMGKTSSYYLVQLCKHNELKKRLIHRLVAMVFLDEWNPDLEVNHKDGNKLNNRAKNLEMCTRKENLNHAITHHLKKDYGENHVHAKLTNEQAAKVRNLHHWGIRQTDLAAMYGVCKQTICDIIHHKTYCHENQ